MPKKICNQIACNELIPMSERYCEAHRREVKTIQSKSYNRHKRNQEHQQFYSSREWRRVRKLVLEESGGLCQRCKGLDIITNADVVDHIIPITKEYSKRLDLDNLQPLCHSCHNRKTADDLLLYGEGV